MKKPLIFIYFDPCCLFLLKMCEICSAVLVPHSENKIELGSDGSLSVLTAPASSSAAEAERRGKSSWSTHTMQGTQAEQWDAYEFLLHEAAPNSLLVGGEQDLVLVGTVLGNRIVGTVFGIMSGAGRQKLGMFQMQRE